MQKREKGLSTVEFVVVIAIVVVSGLLCAACPGFYHDRSAARRQSCQNNLKQWGLIFTMYAGESRGGYWPPMSGYAAPDMGSVAMPDMRAVYPEYLSDPLIAKCLEDETGGFGYPSALPFGPGLQQIQTLMETGDATQDCMLFHVTVARSYVYMNYAVRTPAEGEVAWTAWSKAGNATLLGAQGAGGFTDHPPSAFAGVIELGPECPYAMGGTIHHLHGRILGGSMAPDGPFMNPEGDIVTGWRGDPTADPPTELGWDPEKGARVPEVIVRMHQRITRNVVSKIGDLPQNTFPEADIPVMWDVFANSLKSSRAGAPDGVVVQISNHIPGGSNVLFMDGHVEFVPWSHPEGTRFPMRATAPQTFGDGKEWLNKTATNSLLSD